MNFDHHISAGSQQPPVPRNFLFRLINRFYRSTGFHLVFAPLPDHGKVMFSFYQQINFYHLFNEVIRKRIQGDVVELGCFEGQTTLFFRRLMNAARSNKKLMVYDSFQFTLGLANGNIRERLIANFNSSSLQLPEIVEGDFFETIPLHLPDKIAFLHIDTGYGGDILQHKNVILHCLTSAYDKMPDGAVGILMDYHDPAATLEGADSNPGVKLACDEFFKNRKEEVYTLYGGQYSHGYFIKGFERSA